MHEKQHQAHTSNKYKCDLCNKSFSLNSVLTLRSLREHLVHQLREQPFKCDISAKTYINITGLKVHKESHTSERRYECSVCDKRFARSDHLYAHEKMHAGIKPYKCDLCNKMFASSQKLRLHRATHSEVRLLFKCDLCDKYLKSEHGRIVDRKRHEEKFSYKCFVCKETFCMKILAEEHKRIHPPYKCDLCDKYFITGTSLEVAHSNTLEIIQM